MLAGHSFGGLYVLTFAARYPDEVAGMVLIDSTAPASATKPTGGIARRPGSYDVMGRVSALVSTSARLGLGRLYAPARLRQPAAAVPGRGATPAPRPQAICAARSTSIVQANTSMEEAASLGDFADKPLVVLTAGSGSDAAHLASQDELATLSTNSAHRVIDGATHEALVADEDAAATTTQAILDVVSSVRSADRWSADHERSHGGNVRRVLNSGREVIMRLWRRAGHHPDKGNNGPDPDTCEHTWRLRDVSLALPGPYVCEVCDRCASLRLHGPEEITGPATRVDDGAAIHLESLARQRSPRPVPLPSPPER